MKTGRFKILKMLWIVVASVGVVTALLAIMVPMGNVHHASRTIKRLDDLDKAPSGFTPSVTQYRDGCTDAKYLWDAMGTMANIVFAGGGVVAALSVLGFGITYGIQKRETNAQQTSADDVANRAAPAK